MNAVAALQPLVRGFLARRRYASVKAILWLRRRERAVVTVQRVARGRTGRREAAALRNARELAAMKAQLEAELRQQEEDRRRAHARALLELNLQRGRNAIQVRFFCYSSIVAIGRGSAVLTVVCDCMRSSFSCNGEKLSVHK